jgi:iron-only hydrogenase group A
MIRISRRKFIRKACLYNASLLFGTYWLSSCEKSYGSTSGLDYLPIQNSNPAIARWPKKCEECGDCTEVCREKQKVFGTYNASATNHVCIHCGACIGRCDEGALTLKYNWMDVLNAIDNPSKIVIASISPSVRVGIGDYFGMDGGSFLPENLVGACKAAGFDYVLDTNFSADLTVMEEASELQKRINEKANLPQFTSCCPAWVKYVEIYYPSLIKHLSTTRSPIAMQGSLIKSYFAQKKGVSPNNIVHVAITPCSAKKFEITRDELNVDNLRSTDISITTSELALLLKKRSINLTAQNGNFDLLMSTSSGAGVIFGNTGGVMRAALRTAHYNITGTNPSANLLYLSQVQGLTGLKEAVIKIGTLSLNVAVCYEMRNAKMLLDQTINGTCKYDYIEVMACKGGCVGGAGQPASNSRIEKRISALNTADSQASNRYSHDNPEIKILYRDFLGGVGDITARKYLHTTYNDKSGLLISL